MFNKLDLKLFVSLNNGELIDIYSDGNILPNTDDDFKKFKLFLKQEQIFFNLLDIDLSIIDDLTYRELEIFNKVNLSGLPTEESNNIRKIILAYKIFKSYYNFLEHIRNPDEYKDFVYVLENYNNS